MFETVPNQKLMCNSGKEKCDKENIYAKINKYALLQAMRDLKPATYHVWLYIASQKKDYTFAFSPTAVSKETGMHKRTIQNAVRELIKDNYLIQRNDGSKIYDFHEVAVEEEEEIKIHTL